MTNIAPKKFFSSKTHLLGLTTLIVSILTFFQGQDYIVNNPTAVSYIGAAVGVLTIVLRQYTLKPVETVVEFLKR